MKDGVRVISVAGSPSLRVDPLKAILIWVVFVISWLSPESCENECFPSTGERISRESSLIVRQNPHSSFGRKFFKGSVIPSLMTWIRKNDPHYGMIMTDGYISPSAVVRSLQESYSKNAELAIAKHFYRLNKRPRGPPGQRDVPNPLHIWVIGKKGWLNQPASQTDIFQKIHEGEQDDNYRMFIVGSGWPKGGYIGFCQDWLWKAGMRKKKRHSRQRDFMECGGVLLDLMFEEYHEEQKVPSVVLGRFGVPYTFYGDEGRRRVE